MLEHICNLQFTIDDLENSVMSIQYKLRGFLGVEIVATLTMTADADLSLILLAGLHTNMFYKIIFTFLYDFFQEL